MDTNSKKSFDGLRDQEVDGKNVKGGFVLTRQEEGIGYYTYHGADDRNAAMSDAKKQGFKAITLTNKATGESRTLTL